MIISIGLCNKSVPNRIHQAYHYLWWKEIETYIWPPGLGSESTENKGKIRKISNFYNHPLFLSVLIPRPDSQIHVQSIKSSFVNTLRPTQNGRQFPDDIFKCIFLNENAWISIKISLKFVPKGPINKIPALVQIMAWRLSGDKPLSEPMMVSLLTHICVTRPQWVKGAGAHPQNVLCRRRSHALRSTLVRRGRLLFFTDDLHDTLYVDSFSITKIVGIVDRTYWRKAIYLTHDNLINQNVNFCFNTCPCNSYESSWVKWYSNHLNICLIKIVFQQTANTQFNHTI